VGNTVRVLGIAGSLRRGSYNQAALRAAKSLSPEGMEIDIFDNLGDIPLFNQDDEKESSRGCSRIETA
jgi:chromate reductase, NAD(P)H dehydrogenase (quinone)